MFIVETRPSAELAVPWFQRLGGPLSSTTAFFRVRTFSVFGEAAVGTGPTPTDEPAGRFSPQSCMNIRDMPVPKPEDP